MDIMNLYQNSGNKVMSVNSSGYVGIGTDPLPFAAFAVKNRDPQHGAVAVFNSKNQVVLGVKDDGTMTTRMLRSKQAYADQLEATETSTSQLQVGSSDVVTCFASGKVSTESIAPATTKDFVVTFTVPRVKPPTIMLTKEDVTNGRFLDVSVKAQSITGQGFTITVRNVNTRVAASCVVHWFAMCTA